LSPHQILAACSRIGALVWGICAIRQAPEFWVHMDHPTVDNRAPILLLTAIQLAVCAFLWFFPATVARKILPTRQTIASAPARLIDWQMLGVVLVGLWALTQAIPRAFYWAIVLHTLLVAEFGLAASLTAVQKGQIAATVVEIIIAAWFVFGARTITTYLFGVRQIGRRE